MSGCACLKFISSSPAWPKEAKSEDSSFRWTCVMIVHPSPLRTFCALLTCHPPRLPLVPTSGEPAGQPASLPRHRPVLVLVLVLDCASSVYSATKKRIFNRPTYLILSLSRWTKSSVSFYPPPTLIYIARHAAGPTARCALTRHRRHQDAPEGMEPPSLGRVLDMLDRSRPVADTRTPTASPSGRPQSGTQCRPGPLRPHTCQEGL